MCFQNCKDCHFKHFVCKDDSGTAILCMLVYSCQSSAKPNAAEYFSHILLFFSNANFLFVPKFVINIWVSASVMLG
jgi:hypothetical protein